jgi:hypothetical protein
VKFDIEDLYEKPVEKIQIRLKSYNNTGHFIFRPGYVRIVDSSVECFVDQQKGKGNPFLPFHVVTSDDLILFTATGRS